MEAIQKSLQAVFEQFFMEFLFQRFRVLVLWNAWNFTLKNKFRNYQILNKQYPPLMSTQKKEKGLQKYSFRGYTPEQLNELNQEQLVELFRARQRRRFARKIKHKYNRLYLKCKKSKKNTQPGEKPAPVKTHLRDAIIMPDMVGNFVAVYNGKAYNIVQVKFDMIGRYLGEFSLTYKATRHGKAGVGATKGSAHTSLK